MSKPMSSNINGPVTVKACGGYAVVFLDADGNVIPNNVILTILNRDDWFDQLVEALKESIEWVACKYSRSLGPKREHEAKLRALLAKIKELEDGK